MPRQRRHGSQSGKSLRLKWLSVAAAAEARLKCVPPLWGERRGGRTAPAAAGRRAGTAAAQGAASRSGGNAGREAGRAFSRCCRAMLMQGPTLTMIQGGTEWLPRLRREFMRAAPGPTGRRRQFFAAGLAQSLCGNAGRQEWLSRASCPLRSGGGRERLSHESLSRYDDGHESLMDCVSAGPVDGNGRGGGDSRAAAEERAGAGGERGKGRTGRRG